jgi:hypothetical protein
MANMGYFVLDLGPSPAEKEGLKEVPPSSSKENAEEIQEEDNITTMNSIFKMEAAPDHVFQNPEYFWSPSKKINTSRLSSRFWALNVAQWNHIFRLDLADAPEVSVPLLEMLDKGGTLVKTLALVQVVYLIVQLTVRKVGGFLSAQIEIAALAFAACSIITYYLYWSQPQGIEAIPVIKAKSRLSATALEELRRLLGFSGPTYLWLSPRTQATFYPEIGPDPIPNDAMQEIGFIPGGSSFNGLLRVAFGALFGGTLFGSLHCLAWNFHFSTPGEALGWKVCSIATT